MPGSVIQAIGPGTVMEWGDGQADEYKYALVNQELRYG